MIARWSPSQIIRSAAVLILLQMGVLSSAFWLLIPTAACTAALRNIVLLVIVLGGGTALLLWLQREIGYLSALSLFIGLAVIASGAVLFAPRFAAAWGTSTLRSELMTFVALLVAGLNTLAAYSLGQRRVRLWFLAEADET